MDSMKKQKDMTLKDELPRSVGAHYATGKNLGTSLAVHWLRLHISNAGGTDLIPG